MSEYTYSDKFVANKLHALYEDYRDNGVFEVHKLDALMKHASDKFKRYQEGNEIVIEHDYDIAISYTRFPIMEVAA